MVRANLITVDDNELEYICNSCNDRYFTSEKGLLSHCRSSRIHEGEWCERCEWLFISPNAKAQHLQQSSKHWICRWCKEDLHDQSELGTHYANVHEYCIDCQEYFEDHVQHRIESHRRCPECDQEFGNDNNLRMHSQVHLPLNAECPGCDRCFISDSAVFIHLESGTCDCGVDVNEIDIWAFECYQSGYYTNDWLDKYRFRCPSCGVNFRVASALLQHTEHSMCANQNAKCIRELKAYVNKMVASFADSATSDTS